MMLSWKIAQGEKELECKLTKRVYEVSMKTDQGLTAKRNVTWCKEISVGSCDLVINP